VKKKKACPRVAEYVRDFRWRRSPVQGNEDGPKFCRSQLEFKVFMAIIHKDADPIPLVDAFFQKKVRQPVAPPVEFSIAEFTALINDCRFPGRQQMPLPDLFTHMHYRPSPLREKVNRLLTCPNARF